MLEIHHINVGTGDSTLIAVRDVTKTRTAITPYKNVSAEKDYNLLKIARDNNVVLSGTIDKAVLIDSGNGSTQGDIINKYLNDIGVTKLDYVLTSHFHQDHFGGYPVVLKKYKGTYVPYDRSNIAPKAGTTFTKYRDNLTENTTQAIKEIAQPGAVSVSGTNSLELAIGNKGQKIVLRIIESNSTDLNGASVAAATSQNDAGFGWLLQYGAFRYFSGGDLGGFDQSNYICVETPMIDELVKKDTSVFTTNINGPMDKGHICSFKLNHHGSRYSTNAWFISTMRPTSAIISCGDRHGHPHKEAIEDLDAVQWDISDWKGVTTKINNTLQNYYVTGLLNNFGDLRDNIDTLGNKGVIGGDIVIIVDDSDIDTASKYNIYWNGRKPGNAVKDNNDMRDPAGAGEKYIECHKATSVSYI